MKDVKLDISTSTFVRFWLVILGFVAAIGLIWLARGALITVGIAFFLALVLNRPVSFIARHLPGRSRAFATLIAYLIIVAIIVLIFFNVVPIFAKQISLFLNSLPATLHNLQNQSHVLDHFLDQYHLTAQYDAWLADMQKQIGSIASSIGGSFMGALSGLANALIGVVFVAVLTFLMLIEGPTWEEKFWRLLYKNDVRRRHHKQLAKKMYEVVSGYVSGQAIVAALSATLTALVVAILSRIFHFDLALAWPAWSILFVSMFVPMFGSTIGGIIIGILLMLYSWPAAIIYICFLIIEQNIEGNVVVPHIQSKKLNMSALLILVAVIVGLQVAGLLGALVAIPVVGCIVVLLRDVLRNRRVRMAAEDGVIIDPDNDEADAPVVFTEEQRKFVKPKLPRRSSRKQD